MRVAAHIKKFYDWQPVPSDVKVTKEDIAAGKVKPAANGGWVMKVTRNTSTSYFGLRGYAFQHSSSDFVT